ncbi:hypothetical protein GCM10008927_00800 [Amylibacter ulvae]|uniref:Uncharacterized protein n=1 Tax=Paramylibacter ulvae TaxID=1651968 RepID=A0ABQ3CRB0_9RHOB|nr:ABZJ_00895 family protein [Amylibacter ulvae]GHA40478.1 hypothetical protein GCM10008927_00800 [Amylibacter ulvae]
MTSFDIKPLIKRFAIAYVLASVGVALVVYLLEKIFGVSGGSGAGMISVMVAAMDMGQTFYKQNNRIPEKSESWRMARWAMIVVFAFTLLVLLFVFITSPQFFATMGIPGLLVILLFVLLISFLATRFFIGFGAKNLAKVEARKNNA